MHVKEQPTRHKPGSLALFCKVVDNYGDIGICWRLARQLQHEHGIRVSLWVDDLISFQRICPEVDINSESQLIAGVSVRHWHDQQAEFNVSDIADIVIEFFACDIPPAYIKAMAKCTPSPVWLNLEGLTAEQWVEGCHTLPSPHPSLPLTKYFFFPGFTNKTGGLLVESALEQQRQAFQDDVIARQAFLAKLGLSLAEIDALKISLFCYPQAPVNAMFDVWQHGSTAICCLAPEGVAADAVKSFLGQDAIAGTSATRGALTVRVLPFIPQPDYDRLLWACDMNFVRGEDSFVRAQWAGKPFIWHIYPQDENLHHKKLKAFLQCHTANTPDLHALSLAWNGVTGHGDDYAAMWNTLHADFDRITGMSNDWRQQMLENGDLASNLVKFVNTVSSGETKK
ncbi:elongation factor P maturation arginine rhamnosyltransferase EarP [Undibacterium sp. TJN19]|uniref:elongation factor P maturation arginine rhamnosyltransferase EarP n=1 Tax=Undibacterium sp. TJN19 TaxID=3413055 RepID=UPI003BF28345